MVDVTARLPMMGYGADSRRSPEEVLNRTHPYDNGLPSRNDCIETQEAIWKEALRALAERPTAP